MKSKIVCYAHCKFILQEVLNFTFVIHIPEDGEYGIQKSPGKWSGMVGQLAEHKTDIGRQHE